MEKVYTHADMARMIITLHSNYHGGDYIAEVIEDKDLVMWVGFHQDGKVIHHSTIAEFVEAEIKDFNVDITKDA